MAAAMNTQFSAEMDTKRNVLHVRFCGAVKGARLERESEQLVDLLKNTSPGFTVVADFTALDSMDLDCLPAVTRMMDLHMAAKVGRVIRVIPDPAKDIGFNILSITHYRGRVRTLTCATRAEAEAALDSAAAPAR